jgi:transcriptional regulator NrdR family protein
MYASIYNAYLRNKNVDSGDCASKAEEITKRIEKELIIEQIKEIRTEDLRLIIIKQLTKDDFAATLNYISYFIAPRTKSELGKVFRG